MAANNCSCTKPESGLNEEPIWMVQLALFKKNRPNLCNSKEQHWKKKKKSYNTDFTMTLLNIPSRTKSYLQPITKLQSIILPSLPSHCTTLLKKHNFSKGHYLYDLTLLDAQKHLKMADIHIGCSTRENWFYFSKRIVYIEILLLVHYLYI